MKTEVRESPVEWVMHSKAEKRAYWIRVAIPKQPEPIEGYPIIYVLDGNAYFQLFQDIVRMQSVRAGHTGVNPAIIVGIGYPGEQDFATEYRVYDYTPPSSSVTLPPKPDGKPWPKSGGANHFIQFIEEELKPHIESTFLIDRKKQTLFGHSLGGLFTLFAMFTKPNVFQNYIAISPSIWWNDSCILLEEQKWKSEELLEDVRLFLGVGSLEKPHMVSEAQDMYKRFAQMNKQNFYVDYMKAEGENHASVVPTTISRGLRFVMEN